MSEEEELGSLSDAALVSLLDSARQGNTEHQEKLCSWAYYAARDYFLSKVETGKEQLCHDDAEDLASSFYLEFERALPRVQDPARYTRFVIKRNLGRFLKKQRGRQMRHSSLRDEHISELAEEHPTGSSPWQDWDDNQFDRYKAVLRALDQADAITRSIIAFRLEAPPLSFTEIAESLKMSEPSVRMRMTRFYARARRLYSYKSRHGIPKLIKGERRNDA